MRIEHIEHYRAADGRTTFVALVRRGDDVLILVDDRGRSRAAEPRCARTVAPRRVWRLPVQTGALPA